MKKVCLIFNPVAGAGNAPQQLEEIRTQLIDHVALDVRFTDVDRSATALAQGAIAEGVDLIIASGGDGTVSQVAAVLLNSDTPMAVIPRGTANAFAAALGLPTDINGACEVILTGEPQRIDGATCNGQPMTLLAGIGLEAEAISNTARETKQQFGFFAYLFTAFQQLQQLDPFHAELDLGDRQLSLENVLAITVANVAPSTSILAQGTGSVSGKDGLLDVTILKMPEESEILGVLSASYELFLAALRQDTADHPYIESLRTETVTISTDQPRTLLLDGEVVGETPVHCQIIPDSLLIQMPKPQT